MKKKRFNCETARRFSIIEVLEKLGQFPGREPEKEAWILSPFRSETQASYKVSKTRNRWFEHGIGKGMYSSAMQLQYFSTENLFFYSSA